MKRASLKSIAARAGVSKTTASFVLNGKGDLHKISKSTQQRILATAKDMDYHPSFLAQTLSSGITHTLGFIWNNEQADLLLPHLMTSLEKGQYRLLPGKAFSIDEKTKLVEDFLRRQTDAVIAFDDAEVGKWGRVLKEKNIPLLLIPSLVHPSGPILKSGLIHQLFNILLQHHFQHHRKAIGYVGLSHSHPDLAKGFKECYLQRFGMNHHLLQCLSSNQEVPEALHRLADNPTKAIIFEHPELLRRALSYLQNHPFDRLNEIAFSTLGWSNSFEWAQPQVSAADLDYRQLAQDLADWVSAKSDPKPKIQFLETACRLYP